MENTLPMLPLPKMFELRFEPSNWLKVKAFGVKEIAKKFEESPKSGIVLGDRQFGDKPVVIMRLENYEILLKTVRDLSEGEAFVKNSLEALTEQISLINHMIEEDKSLANSQIGKAVRVMSKLEVNISSIIKPYVNKGKLRPQKSHDDVE